MKERTRTATLIIGVVLVVLAGAVFATTTWAVLPAVCKVLCVLVCAGLFFGASWLAEKKLQLRGTGWAFYTLGSVFLFLTMIAIGYFKIFGDSFALQDENRWKVLLAGSLVTEIAWCLGYKRFHDRAYTLSCLWGTTVCMTFLLLSCRMGVYDFINGMVAYASVIVLAAKYWIKKDQNNEEIQSWSARSVFWKFATIHYMCLSPFVVFTFFKMYGPDNHNEAIMLITLVLQLVTMDILTKKKNELRIGIPVLIGMITWEALILYEIIFDTYLQSQMWFFVYLVALAIWDLVKKDDFWIVLVVVSSFAQILYCVIGRLPLPMMIFVGAYLVIKGIQAKPEEEEYFKGSSVMLLVGTYIFLLFYTDTYIEAALPGLMIFTGIYGYVFRRGKKTDAFWNSLAGFVPAVAVCLFYTEVRVEGILWYLIPCLVTAVINYSILYQKKSWWAHLILAVAFMPLPIVLIKANVFLTEYIVGATAGIYLVTGILARWKMGAIIQIDSANENLKVDWHHMVAVGSLLGVMFHTNMYQIAEKWMTPYLILLGLYILQYAELPKMKKGSCSIALVFMILAWWAQKFVQWPQTLSLEMGLFPIVAGTLILPLIWGGGRTVMWVCRAIQSFCLLILVSDGMHTGLVTDALIIEGICLMVFVGSQMKKSVWWMRISGSVLIIVALYMTKSFWLSISWWVYLLVAGLGLIAFAAFGEKRRQEKNFDTEG